MRVTKPGIESVGTPVSSQAWPLAPFRRTLAQIPNALTIFRLALIPPFIVLIAPSRRRLQLGGRR